MEKIKEWQKYLPKMQFIIKHQRQLLHHLWCCILLICAISNNVVSNNSLCSLSVSRAAPITISLRKAVDISGFSYTHETYLVEGWECLLCTKQKTFFFFVALISKDQSAKSITRYPKFLKRILETKAVFINLWLV